MCVSDEDARPSVRNGFLFLLPTQPLNLEPGRDLRLRFLQHDLAVQLGHLLVFLLGLPGAKLLLAGRLRNALRIAGEDYARLGIDPKLRPENLSPQDYARLTALRSMNSTL